MPITYTLKHCGECNSGRGVHEFRGLCADCYRKWRNKWGVLAALAKRRWCRFCGDSLDLPRIATTSSASAPRAKTAADEWAREVSHMSCAQCHENAKRDRQTFVFGP